MDIVPAKEYRPLLRQFIALKNLYNSIQGEIALYRDKDYSLQQSKLDALNESLDSEKAMNETLTNENESLRNQLANEPDWSDSKTLLSESWKNPLTDKNERLLIADGAVRFRDDVIRNLRNQLAECQKDAERYRWLMNDCDGNKQDDLFQWMAGNVFSRSYIDEAIDQEISEKG